MKMTMIYGKEERDLRMRGRLINPGVTVEVANVVDNRHVVGTDDDDYADTNYLEFRKQLIDHYMY